MKEIIEAIIALGLISYLIQATGELTKELGKVREQLAVIVTRMEGMDDLRHDQRSHDRRLQRIEVHLGMESE